MLIPIAATVVDWKSYGASVRKLDNAGIDLNTPTAFLATLGEGDPVGVIRESYDKKHTDLIHLVFKLIDDTTDCGLLPHIAKYTRLNIVDISDCILLAGTLTVWIDSIIACSRFQHPLCGLMNAAYAYLARGGLHHCFHNYERKINLIDNTFTLKHRGV